MTINIKTDNKSIKYNENGLCINISEMENNGLTFENNEIKITKGINGTDGENVGVANTGGNAINCKTNEPISILRCNNTVSRKSLGDPLPSNEGVLMLSDNGLIKRIRLYVDNR